MIVAIHQPEFMPYAGFFHKMNKADQYIILDDVQFTKNNFQNRNRLCDRNGEVFWVTAPIKIRGHTASNILDIKLESSPRWKRKAFNRISAEYGHHPYFKNYSEELERILMSSEEKLISINMKFISFFRRELDIHTPLTFSSALKVHGSQTTRLVNLCKALKANVYLSGMGGTNYINRYEFEQSGIELKFQNFKSPVYPSPNFVPNLSIFDLLMNAGPNSRNYFL